MDIIIRKKTKNTVKITYQNRDFTLNKWGVFCVLKRRLTEKSGTRFVRQDIKG